MSATKLPSLQLQSSLKFFAQYLAGLYRLPIFDSVNAAEEEAQKRLDTGLRELDSRERQMDLTMQRYHLRNDLRSFAIDSIRRVEILEKKTKDVSDKLLNDILGPGYGYFPGRKRSGLPCSSHPKSHESQMNVGTQNKKVGYSMMAAMSSRFLTARIQSS